MAENLIINLHYLPVSGIFSFICKSKNIIVDDISLFKKQSYSNRAHIAAANGKLALIIPVKQGKTRLPVNKVLIDNSVSWQRIHWQSLVSAYNNSPWFEFYKDNFFNIYQNKFTYLFDLNYQILCEMMKIFNIKKEVRYLSEFKPETDILDLRNYFHPKEKHNQVPEYYSEKQYIQVFQEKHGFIKSLSAVDLLFNCGNDSSELLQKAIIN